MKNLFRRITKPLRLLRARIPEPLPVGLTDFNKFCSRCLELYGFPDNDSTRRTIARMITQLGPLQTHIAMNHFGRAVYKAMADEVVHYYMSELIRAERELDKKLKLNEDSAKIAFDAMNRCPESHV